MSDQNVQLEEGTAPAAGPPSGERRDIGILTRSFWEAVRNRCSYYCNECCSVSLFYITFSLTLCLIIVGVITVALILVSVLISLLIGLLIFVVIIVAIDVVTEVSKYVVLAVLVGLMEERNFLLFSVIAIILDPLFFYIPVLNDKNKCIELDKNLGITATVLRSLFDLLKLFHITLRMHDKLRLNKKERKEAAHATARLWIFFLIDIPTILPIPQVLVCSQRIRGTKYLFAMTFFLLQYLLRVIRTFFLFKQATGVSGILAEDTWAIVAFNVLLYMHGGHVFGALWYFFAIEKASACWKQACRNHTGCSHSSLNCNGSFRRDNNFINDFCAIKTGNETNYDFGLFNDALQSGIVEVTDFLKKFLYCLQWGLQNLSAFGQNLQTGTDVWDNVFAICMTNFGVLLFVFLIGKMQSDTARSEKIKQKWREIMQWPHIKNISDDVQGKLKKYKRKDWQETKRVGVDNLVNELPEDLGKEIKRKLCLTMLKNVKEFKMLSKKSLGDMCDCLKPVLFSERTRIIREGDPIDEMIFVLKGKLWTYSSASASSSRNDIVATTVSTLIDRRSRENHLQDGDFCGQQLIAWAQQNELSSSSNILPISTQTVQALTNVEAFTLMADDLKHVLLLSHYDRAALVIQSYWRFKRFFRAGRNAQKKPFLGSLLDRVRKGAREGTRPVVARLATLSRN